MTLKLLILSITLISGPNMGAKAASKERKSSKNGPSVETKLQTKQLMLIRNAAKKLMERAASLQIHHHAKNSRTKSNKNP